MKTARYTIDYLHQQFPDDNTCLDYIFQQRFGGMVSCPKCGVTEPKYYRVRSKKVYECKDCGNQISTLANTIFHKSETPLKKWFYATFVRMRSILIFWQRLGCAFNKALRVLFDIRITFTFG
jgi:transposase-like protein